MQSHAATNANAKHSLARMSMLVIAILMVRRPLCCMTNHFIRGGLTLAINLKKELVMIQKRGTIPFNIWVHLLLNTGHQD